MAFRAAFIGINKHQDPGVLELAGATRDAVALHALFSDTFSHIDCQLLLDEQATLAQVRTTIAHSLGGATGDDVVVLSFAGHGTRGHQIVTYDTDRDALADTSLPMKELAAAFQASKARAVLCIVDCCFSGAAPARVLEGTAAPRAELFDYSAFEGKGRFLLAAASPTQPAWEDANTGHGLLTRSIIDILTTGTDTNDIAEAVARIIARTRELAAAIGEQQDPCFVGGVEGVLALPRLVRGPIWRQRFPDFSTVEIGRDVRELAQFGLPSNVLRQWQGRFPDGLNDLQLEAVNRYRVLTGASLLVVAPTSSGKTFIGELAAVRAALAGRKAVFLLPYRALVNEKYEDFSAVYGPTGLRTVRCAGDFTDDVWLFVSGRYDIAILTFEMFLGLSVSSPHVLKKIGALILDEAQFITDPNRGIAVELLLTLILAGREHGVSPQLIVLSAVIGDVNRFDEWLKVHTLRWTRRPVPLTEGVLDRSGVYQVLTPEGLEQELQLLPPGVIHQRRKEPSAQDVIVPLCRALVSAREKILVFRNTRGPAEGCAAYLARELGLRPAAEALDALPAHDLSSSSARLREALAGGMAFHNSNLHRDERLVVERFFRNPAGGIEVLAATTTLAAGINTPASTVVLAEQEFIGDDGRPFTVAEYKNMAGRAGRLGFNESGKAIILADNAIQRRELFQRYVRGAPEPIRSSFSNDDVRTWIIRLLSQVQAIPESAVPKLLINTYGGFLAGAADKGWVARIEQTLAFDVTQFIQLGLLEREGENVRLTLLGRACGQSSLSFDSAMRLVEAIRALPAHEISAFQLVGILQMLPEADDLYTPVRKTGRAEAVRVHQAAATFGAGVIGLLRRWVPNEIAFWARCKRAAILGAWMTGLPMRAIEDQFTVAFGGQVQSGDVQRFADNTRFHLQSAHQIFSTLLIGTPEQEQEFENVALQLEFGVPADLVPMMRRPLALTRGECLAAAQRGYRTLPGLAVVKRLELDTLFGRRRAEQIAGILAR